jgi:hypothetical protein
VRPVKVPTEVTLGWEGLLTTPATLAAATLPTRLEEFRFDKPEAFPVYRSACKTPVTVNDVNCPKEVTLGWAGWETTRATSAVATLPTKFEEFRFEIPEPFPMYRLDRIVERFDTPETFREFSTPRLVMFGWAGFVTLEATSAVTTFPIMFEELKLYRPDASPMYRLARTVFRFEIPKTLRVADPKTVAEFTYRVETFRVSVMLAEPSTYRLEPSGGALRVPMDTPFW